MEQNGTTKRKQPPTSPATDRPVKQIKPEIDAHTSNGVMSHSPDQEEAMDDAHSEYSSHEEIPSSAHITAVTGQDTAEWQRTIENVVKSVVSIHFCQTCSFDTDPAISSEATGFVVDAEKGYILTNRHVVGAGPFIGYCIFDNHEECDVHPVYRDPVHDFGFLKFDPKAISRGLAELRPDNFRYHVVSKEYPGDWNLKEKWYGTEYKIEKIPAEFMKELEATVSAPASSRPP